MKVRFFPRIILLIAAFVAVAGCVPKVSNLPEKQPVRTVTVGQDGDVMEEGSVITHGLEEDRPISSGTDPWKLAQEAETAPPGDRETLLLEAIGAFIEIGRHATARTLLEQLNPSQLSAQQQRRRDLLQAQLEQSMGKPQQALKLLQPLLSDSELTQNDRSQALLIQASSLESLGQIQPAIQSLMDRDALLTGAAQVENQRRLLSLLGGLSSQQLQNLRANSADTYLTGWTELALILNQTPMAEREQQLIRWRDLYPHHPAAPQLLAQQGQNAEHATNYNTVSLLLPLTSSSGSAAQAFYDGFMAAHARSTAPQRPTVTLYDIGDDSTLAAFYYQAARNEGANFVVGPLGRLAVAQLLTQTTPDLPTLLLGPLPDNRNLPDVYSFSLSPEQDARQAAAEAASRGFRKAVVIGADSSWGRRVGEAFTKEWRSLGGSVMAEEYFPPTAVDLSGTVKKALAVNLGYEQQSATKQGGRKVKPRRGRDVDCIFLAVKPAEGRLLVPQLRFFDAHDLPLYSTAYVYSAQPNAMADSDLDGVIFGDIRWLLAQESPATNGSDQPMTDTGADDATENVEAPLQTMTSTPRPYRNSPLERLYALGIESYDILPRLRSLQANPWQQYGGLTMNLSVAADGTVVRHPVWAKFRGGRPQQSSPGVPLQH